MPLTVTITATTTATDLAGHEHPLAAGTYDVVKATPTVLLIDDRDRDGNVLVETADPAVDFRLAAFAVVDDSAVRPFKSLGLFTADGTVAGGDVYAPSDTPAVALARLGYKTVGEPRTHLMCGCAEYDVVPTDFRV